uniref:Uncharacterized protein n=1 Tax=Rhizophagus irregularis (strain DAOM 181602 / DAOM 197198 / MUCL 43194) TaxID=747089 RepID=U9TND8_RHIID
MWMQFFSTYSICYPSLLRAPRKAEDLSHEEDYWIKPTYMEVYEYWPIGPKEFRTFTGNNIIIPGISKAQAHQTLGSELAAIFEILPPKAENITKREN